MSQDTLLTIDGLWAGTDHSFEVACAAYASINQMILAGQVAQPEEDEDPYLFYQHGNLGFVKVHGSLVTREHWANRYFGITSYEALREALIFAAEKPDLEGIVLDVASGGGAVSGVYDTGELITMIDQQFKPVFTVAENVMASAAYWLGVSARRRYASPTALVGSIGTMMVHSEASKMRKAAGITDTVLREGKFKALVNGIEPLTDEAKAQAQLHLKAANDLFLSHVSARLNSTPERVQATIGEGREFMGAAAMEVGLVDAVAGFDRAVASIQSILDSQRVTQSQFGHNLPNPMKRTLNAQTAAAAALAGIDPESLGATTPPAAPAAPAATTEAVQGGAEQAPAAETAAPVAAAAPAAQPDPVTVLLQSQLAASQASLTDMTMQLATANARAASLEAAQPDLARIVAGSVSTMRIALGMSALDLSAVAPAALVAEHKALHAKFTAQFAVGGVAAASSSDAAQTAHQKPTALTQAAVQATRFIR